MRRTAPARVLLLLVPFAARSVPAEEEDPLATPIRAVVVGHDAGLRKVYDGIRKGLEQAALPRVSIEPVEDTPESFRALAERLSDTRPPLVFLVGRRAVDHAIAAHLGGRRVFVDVAVHAAGVDHPAAAVPVPPGAPGGEAAVVRGVVQATRWAEVIRGMYPGRTRFPVRLPFTDPEVAEAVVEATGLVLAPDPVSTRPGPLLLSDDVGRWGKGAVAILSPDHFLLGRLAAEAGRRLLRGEDGVHLVSGATELYVDLDAADAAGVALPLPFVAAADRVRARRGR
jgi:hypothetical protein